MSCGFLAQGGSVASLISHWIQTRGTYIKWKLLAKKTTLKPNDTPEDDLIHCPDVQSE